MSSILRKFKDRLPQSYCQFISENKRFCGFLDDEWGYVDLWDIHDLADAWNTLEIQSHLGESWFPIGSNGGGEMIVIKLSSPSKKLFNIPFLTQSEKDAELYCHDFSRLYDAISRHAGSTPLIRESS